MVSNSDRNSIVNDEDDEKHIKCLDEPIENSSLKMKTNKNTPSAQTTTNNNEILLTKRIKINYGCICLLAFLTGCDFAVIIPTLWDRLHNDYDASGVFMGFVISSYSLCGVVSGFIMGKLSDNMKNTKIFYLFSGICAIMGQCLYFFGISKYFILLSRCICGASLGASTVALAYIARTTTEHSRTSVISIVMASRQIGLMFGPAFNLFLRKINFKLFNKFICDRKSSPGLFMSILWFTCLCIFSVLYSNKMPKRVIIKNSDINESLLEGKNKKRNVYKKEFLRIEIIVILLVTFFTYFNQTSLETIVIPFTESYFSWNEIHNSILFCIGGSIIIFSYVIVRIISVRYGDKVALIFGITSILSGLLIGCVLLPFATRLHDNHSLNRTMNTFEFGHGSLYKNLSIQEINENIKILEMNNKLFPAFVLFVFFDVLGLPAIAISSVALFTKMVHMENQGLGQGIQRGVLGFATICGPLFAGPFIHQPIVLIGFTFGLLFIILILIIFTNKHLKPIERQRLNSYQE